jgi:Holliday junction DNA helicase RuvB
MLTSPLRDRFGVINRLEFYNSAELKEIAIRSSRLLGTELHDDAAGEIAARSRGTPRIANRILKRIRDFAQVRGNGTIDMNITREALEALEVDTLGLDEVDRKLLNIIIDKFGGGPAGVEAIAATLREDKDTIEDVYEPFLLQEGLIERTARGRLATRRAYEHLGKAAPKGLF